MPGAGPQSSSRRGAVELLDLVAGAVPIRAEDGVAEPWVPTSRCRSGCSATAHFMTWPRAPPIATPFFRINHVGSSHVKGEQDPVRT